MSKRAANLQTKLLQWYDSHKRILPWRSKPTPYRVWISEIMLQQTQVKTVLPYYRKWMKTFPSLRKLADAPLDLVLKHWEGLGYYSRARNLHKAAREIATHQRARFPNNFDEMLKLPGIGRYTAGAIASIAFGLPKPVLDGNVIRILTRLDLIEENVKDSATKSKLWDLAEAYLPTDRPGDFNQAMMELGATICSPLTPKCTECPVKMLCRAHKKSRETEFPIMPKRAKPIPIEVALGIIWNEGKVLIQKRPAEGLMGGLWEFPGGKVRKRETTEAGLIRELKEELGVDIKLLEKRAEISHAYTKFKVSLHAFDCIITKGKAKPHQATELKWLSPSELRDYAFPAANKKLIPQLISDPTLYS